MKNKVIFGMLFIFTLVIVLSCEKEDKWKDFQKFSTSYSVSGHYVIEEDGFSGLYGPYSLSIYNTANNLDSVWIDNIYDDGIKVKAAFNGTNFNVTKAINVGNKPTTYGSVTINNGVVSNGNISYVVIIYKPDGTTSDSLTVTGKLATGFEE